MLVLVQQPSRPHDEAEDEQLNRAKRIAHDGRTTASRAEHSSKWLKVRGKCLSLGRDRTTYEL